jgi:alpha-tubulin suppressor-like RCC1 family protein
MRAKIVGLGVALSVASAAGASLVAAPAQAGAEVSPAVAGWGFNQSCQLGAGWRSTFEPSPVTAVGVTNVLQVLAAGGASYALLTNHTVDAWGGNWKGELGNGSRKLSCTPVSVTEQSPSGVVRTLSGVTAIAGFGGTHLMALVNDSTHEGEVETWGAAEYGERGNGESGWEHEAKARAEEKHEPYIPRERAALVPNLKHVVEIAAGTNTDYAVKEDSPGVTTLWSWGINRWGKLGLGSTEGPETCATGEAGSQPCSTIPREVSLPAGSVVRAISGGATSAYALLSDGTVLAWGENKHAQFGNGTATNSASPVHVCALGSSGPCPSGPYLTGVTAISGGYLSALALREGAAKGEVVGWGSNGVGELGGESHGECSKTVTTCQLTPKTVEYEPEAKVKAPLKEVTSISEGPSYSLAVSGGLVYAWGLNERGELGIGVEKGPEECYKKPCDRTPTVVEPLENVSSVSAGSGPVGEGHSLATLQKGVNPPLRVTPTSESLAVEWTVPLPEGLNPRYTLRAEEYAGGVETRKYTTEYKQSTGCSQESPCSYTLTNYGGSYGGGPLKPETEYRVILDTEVETGLVKPPYRIVNSRKLLISTLPDPRVPAVEEAPRITGTPQEGDTLSAVPATWSNSPTSYAYRWLRCEGGEYPGGNCLAIAGATGSTYVLTSNDVTHTIRVEQKATNAYGTGHAESAATEEVLPGPPVNTAPPSISGAAELGQTLTEVHGTWTGSPTGFSYQWLRCEAVSGGCSSIVGATTQTYVLGLEDIGHTIRVQEIASNVTRSGAAATSGATGTVLP